MADQAKEVKTSFWSSFSKRGTKMGLLAVALFAIIGALFYGFIGQHTTEASSLFSQSTPNGEKAIVFIVVLCVAMIVISLIKGGADARASTGSFLGIVISVGAAIIGGFFLVSFAADKMGYAPLTMNAKAGFGTIASYILSVAFLKVFAHAIPATQRSDITKSLFYVMLFALAFIMIGHEAQKSKQVGGQTIIVQRETPYLRLTSPVATDGSLCTVYQRGGTVLISWETNVKGALAQIAWRMDGSTSEWHFLPSTMAGKTSWTIPDGLHGMVDFDVSYYENNKLIVSKRTCIVIY